MNKPIPSLSDLSAPLPSQPSARRKNSLLLYLAVLLTGSCGLAYEYTISKVASDLLGNSTRQWAVIIGAMMFFMGLGANHQKVLRRHMLFTWFVLLEMLLSLLGGLSPLLLLGAYAYWQSYYVLWQYLLIAVIGFLIGLEIPIITRINESFTPELKVNLGRTLQMDYVGALGGALLWSYWLIPALPLSRAAAVLGFANMVVTWLFIACFYLHLRWRKWLLLSSSLVSALLLLAFVRGPEWSLRSEQGLYRDPIVLSKTTVYQHLVLTRSARPQPTYLPELPGQSGRETEYRLYINGHLQFSSRDEFVYHENLVHPAFALFRRRSGRDPARVLILGGGDGLALREVRKYPSVREVILCDLDPEMLRLGAEDPIFRRLNQDALHGAELQVLSVGTDIARPEFVTYPALPYLAGVGAGFPRGLRSVGEPSAEWISAPSIILKNLDAARYIREAPGLFDVIIADFPDPNSEALSKLYSLPFYHSVRRKLGPGGVFVQQSTSPAYAHKAFWAIGRSMMAAGLEALPYQDFVPSFGQWGWWLAVIHPAHGASEPNSPAQATQKLLLPEQYRASRLSPALQTRYLSDEIMQANLALAPSFRQMYRESLTLLFVGEPGSSLSGSVDSGAFFRDWVTTYTQNTVYQYYLEASWR